MPKTTRVSCQSATLRQAYRAYLEKRLSVTGVAAIHRALLEKSAGLGASIDTFRRFLGGENVESSSVKALLAPSEGEDFDPNFRFESLINALADCSCPYLTGQSGG